MGVRPLWRRRAPAYNGPPLDDLTSWEGCHGQWPAMVVLALQGRLPRRYVAAPRVHSGSLIEIDVATYEKDDPVPLLQEAGAAGAPCCE